MGIDLPLIWALIIAFGLMMYVFMDGFDLGIGILFPFIRDRVDRDTMVNTVAPVWDGNETWLVLGGAALMGAFPLAYSVLLSALYLPLFFMLVGLILRGVAFEFRFKAHEAHRALWDIAFASGSYLAAFSQGVAIGAFINGFNMSGTTYAGGSFDWLTPFSLFTGVGLILAYALLGSTWLIMKTEGTLQHRFKSMTHPITLGRPGRDCRREPMDARRASGCCGSLVLIPQHHPVFAGAGARRGHHHCHSTRHQRRNPRGAVWPRAIPPVPGLYRPCHQSVAEHHSAVDLDQRGRRAAAKHGLHPGRRALRHPLHSRLHRDDLLRLPREG